ncbi:hypothetical protein JTE90_029242 [Oedothorax gibbosus]|uniref:Uncharacterized protein n=1 Tax=Oedothorax gibbosus TaxID=931172 RepID=A0AAV6TWF8_9ARAC|nr:hypothetical protein JTE90_029242 [Oedothorax gibbosus]
MMCPLKNCNRMYEKVKSFSSHLTRIDWNAINTMKIQNYSECDSVKDTSVHSGVMESVNIAIEGTSSYSEVLENTAFQESSEKLWQEFKKKLPTSPRKKIAVIEKLATDTGLLIKKKSNSANALDENVKNSVADFYVRDDISRQAPGRKDTIVIRKDGKKTKHQRRHLYTVLTEVFQLLKIENPNIKIGFSSFASLGPQHVLLSSETQPNVCVCIYHVNIEFLTCSINKMLPIVPSKSKELVAKLVCSTEQEKCMLGNWVVCKDKYEALTSDVQNGSELISWYAWDSNSERRTVKTVKEGTLDDAINTLEEQIPSFLEHCFIKQSQSEYFQDSKKNVSEKKMFTSSRLQ